MRDGPKRAPSSPPETPEPMKRKPFSRRAFSRRMVSVQRALPPSMMMSPGSKTAARPSITASVGLPAWTRMMALRGLASDAANSSRVLAPTRPPGVLGFSATNLSVFSDGAVVNRDLEAVVGDVEREVLTHHGEADESDVGVRLGHVDKKERSSATRARAGGQPHFPANVLIPTVNRVNGWVSC